METQIERIRKMEKILDGATEGLWKKDFEDDEAGKLPRDLKRGVLSEDGIYDFLDLRDTVMAKMAEVAQCRR